MTDRVARERVVLLHGLSRTARSMARLEAAVRDAGYDALNWDYPSRKHRIPELVELFRALCADLGRDPVRTHFVGHSLGGIIVRAGLLRPVPFPIGRLVMIASPNQGVALVERLQKMPLLADLPRLFGRPALELGRGSAWLKELGVPEGEIGVIAGTYPWHPLNPSAWLRAAMGDETPSDGTVELDSTPLPGMTDFLAVKAAHTFICDEPEVIAATLRFLKNGKF